MPSYEITTPNGRKYIVDAPPGAKQEEVLAYVQANAPKTEAQRSSSTIQGIAGTPSEIGSQQRTQEERERLGFRDRTLEETGREYAGGVSGALSGAASTVLGLPGDVQSILMSGYRGAQRFIAPTSYQEALRNQGSQPGFDFLPTSSTIQEKISSALPQSIVETESFPLYNTAAQILTPLPPAGKLIGIASRPSRAERAARLLESRAASVGEDLSGQINAQRAAEIETARRLKLASMLERQQEQIGDKFVSDGQRVRRDIGEDIASGARRSEEELIARRNQADTALRQTRNEIVRQNEANGIFIDQMPAYQEIIRRTQPYVNERVYGPGLRQSVVPEIRNLYSKLNDAIRTKKIELSPDEARAAINSGATDVEISGDKFYRTFRSSFDAIDELRRYYGQAFAKNVEGFAAIPKEVKKDFYRLLDNIQNQYVGSTQPALQANWRKYSNELKKYETRQGKILTGTQAGTEEFLSTPGRIYETFLGKGRDEINQLIQLTGDENLVQNAVNEYLNLQFANKTPQQIRNLLGPDSKITDMLSHPSLREIQAKTQEYVSNITRKERIGATASEVRESAKASASSSETARRAAADLEILNRQISSLPVNEVGTKLIQFFDDKLKNNTISRELHRQIINEITEANNVLSNRDAYIRKINEILNRSKRLIGKGIGYGTAAAIGTAAGASYYERGDNR